MNTKKYLIGSLIIWVFVFLYDWVFHGILLQTMYQEIPGMMRSEADFGRMFPWLVIGEGLIAFMFCYIFVKGYENKGCMEGVRYGLWIGIGFTIGPSLINYAVHPIPSKLVLAWAVGMPLEMILAGVIFAAIYKPQQA